ncbi:MAG: hypothetical protein M1829_002462 [Trizodia sp. TS-e1964]|nr:MAG: hypothetical protein M1829_002462 [Trizodia sp. TS-e1964]
MSQPPENTLLGGASLLHKIDQLRERNISQYVALPQMIVVGDQSSGKSALLESLTKIPFPRDIELCTRYATQISLRRDPETRVEVTIIPGPNATKSHQNNLASYHPAGLSPANFREKFPHILNEVNAVMGIRRDSSSREGRVFSEDVLKVEVFGPEEDYLTVIDVPGIFRTTAEGGTTDEDIGLVRRMVINYIKHPRTIVLAVIPSNVDVSTQEILTLAKAADPLGERTLGVLTKPDLVQERSAQTVVCNLVLGKKLPLMLGYYLVRNRGADEDASFDPLEAEGLFSKAPWNGLPADRVGVGALKACLTKLLMQITRRDFPRIHAEISKELADCHAELIGLGPARQTQQEQQIFLTRIVGKFKQLSRDAVDAHYTNDQAFDKHPELKLITEVMNLYEGFHTTFKNRAHSRKFQEIWPGGFGTGGDSDVFNSVFANGTFKSRNDNASFEDDILLEHPILENIITKRYECAAPEDGIIAWIKTLYQENRGLDLGMFDKAVVAKAFEKQSEKWKGITQSFMSDVIALLHRFITTVLQMLCPEKRVCDEIWSAIQDEILGKYKIAINQANFLLSIEREKNLSTMNPDFNTALQKTKSKRNLSELGFFTRKELVPAADGLYKRTGADMVETRQLEQIFKSKGSLQQTAEEIHDVLKSYYKIAQRRFVDNIYNQAIGHFLLTGSESPLQVLCPEWVLSLPAKQLERIAAEDSGTRGRRNQLSKKIDDLEMAKTILMH